MIAVDTVPFSDLVSAFADRWPLLILAGVLAVLLFWITEP